MCLLLVSNYCLQYILLSSYIVDFSVWVCPLPIPRKSHPICQQHHWVKEGEVVQWQSSSSLLSPASGRRGMSLDRCTSTRPLFLNSQCHLCNRHYRSTSNSVEVHKAIYPAYFLWLCEQQLYIYSGNCTLFLVYTKLKRCFTAWMFFFVECSHIQNVVSDGCNCDNEYDSLYTIITLTLRGGAEAD